VTRCSALERAREEVEEEEEETKIQIKCRQWCYFHRWIFLFCLFIFVTFLLLFLIRALQPWRQVQIGLYREKQLRWLLSETAYLLASLSFCFVCDMPTHRYEHCSWITMYSI
jgi:heme/copper-type cytochrome/quinol oxidase subunit 3